MIGVGYVVLLVAIGLWPRHVDSALGVANWPLARGIAALIGTSAENVTRLGEMGANVVLFVPVGVLAAWWSRRPFLAAAGVGAVISVGFEVAQWWWLVDRTPSVVDVVTNVTGAVLGCALVRFLPPPGTGRTVVVSAAVVLVVGVLAVLVWGLLTA